MRQRRVEPRPNRGTPHSAVVVKLVKAKVFGVHQEERLHEFGLCVVGQFCDLVDQGLNIGSHIDKHNRILDDPSVIVSFV